MFGPEKIAIKQVISQENYTASMEDDVPGQDKCVLTILAVSDEDEMYLVTGERDLANYGFPRFHYSAIPLRSDVSHISCRYNGHVDITEILYQSTSENSISYMTRDTETSMWTSADLKIKSPQKKHAQSMFLTTLTITNELGQPIPDGYPVHLTAEPMFVSINGLSCRLSRKRPTLAYTTEGLGQIEIKTSAPGDLGVSAVNLSLFKFVESGGDEMTVSINIAQRVTENLGSIKSQADLDNLRSASGASLFANHSTDKRSAATTLLTNFGDLYKGISGENPTGGSDSVDMATIVCETGAKSPKAMILNDYIPEWLDNIVDAAVEYLGDAIECLRQAVKSVTKFAFKIFGSELRFLVKIGAKVLRFVITNTVALVKSVVGFLKDVFEFDLLAWLGFKFDFKKVLETQTVCECE